MSQHWLFSRCDLLFSFILEEITGLLISGYDYKSMRLRIFSLTSTSELFSFVLQFCPGDSFLKKLKIKVRAMGGECLKVSIIILLFWL